MPERLPPVPPTAEQLARLLAGESSPAERIAVRRLLDEHPELARAVERFARALDAEDSRPQPPDATASFAALRRRLPAAEHAAASVAGDSRREALAIDRATAAPVERERAAHVAAPFHAARRWRRALAIGGIVAAAAIALTFRARPRVHPGSVARSYVTADGERAEVQLLDGTLVRMAPGSRIRVAADFGSAARAVDLEGEAYFEVVHDARHPFAVHTKNVSVRDLGTAFAVRAFAEDSSVQVVVRSGVVAMSGAGRLGAGDIARVDADGRSSIMHGADVEAMLGWIHGRLQFTDAPLGRVLADVRRWYGVDVALSDSTLSALPFTGTLSDLSPSDAVALVAATLGMRVRADGDRLVLHPIPGRTPRPRPAPRSPR